ncbi:MAG: S41 family peptidase [Bacteroidales bacterium]|nr:S41 family peptidase [Bacteroidales bacterium]
MKNTLTFFTLLIILSISAFGEVESPYFISEPTLSPDGNDIVFSYENDLWKVPVNGGNAYRLTAMEGKETLPRFSPDGKWIAFTGSQDGRNNIFVMPADGGKIKQLTYHQASDQVDSWSWDSKWIYFSSDRYNLISTYKVSVVGGTPQRLFKHYFNNPHHAIQHPKTNDIYFTDSWESFMFTHRKHYKGDHSPQILSYNLKSNNFTQHTNYKGKDMWPTIDSVGNIYIVSDEFNNEYNLYKLKNGQKTLLTKFENSIKRPQVSANGQKIVFEKDYQLWVYDVASQNSKKVDITLYSNHTLELDNSFNVNGKISSFDVSPDNKKIAFVSRGELFVSDIEGKFVKKMPTNPNERIFEVKWSDDNLTLIYNQTHNGWPNWFSIKANGLEAEKQLTTDKKTNRQLTLNSNRTQGVYLSGRDEVKTIDLKTNKTKTIATDELWGFQSSTPTFSPDDKFIAYTAIRAFEQDIFIYEISTETTFNLTNTGVTEAQPAWSPDGKYIYFTTDRYAASYPRGMSSSTIYRIPLYRFSSDFKLEAFDNIFEKEEKKDSVVTVKFDMTNIQNRWEEVYVRGGEQYNPTVIKVKDETVLLFQSNHDKGENAIWKTVYKPFEKPKTERLSSFRLRSSYDVVQTKKSIYIRANGDIYKANFNNNKLKKININYDFSKQFRAEFNQMFFETWSIIQENFYDENFHGIDWDEKRDYYSSFLPHIKQRDNLRTLLNDMLGSLNASHMGFTTSGEEEKPFYSAHTASLGVVFSNDMPFKVERIISNSNLDLTEKQLQPGDEIIAINGTKIAPSQNREFYLSFANTQPEIKVTINRNGKEQCIVVPTHSSRQISTLLYDEWIASNRHYVEEKSNKKIAYVHMKDMSGYSLNKFITDMTTHADKAEALVLDLRYNRGGNVHDAVLQFLSQRPYLKWRYREGKMAPQPNFAPSGKPIVLLINEHSLSDAEMTAAGFRQLGLGTIVGTETYRWIIFTSGKMLVDGSYVRVPAWGCYTLDGKNLELEGVAPDIYINTTFKDRIENKDPQLDKAIEEIFKQL